jgi:hypothetical protein
MINEEFCLLRVFQRNMMPPPSRLKGKPSKKSAEASSTYSYREVICFSEFGVS